MTSINALVLRRSLNLVSDLTGGVNALQNYQWGLAATDDIIVARDQAGVFHQFYGSSKFSSFATANIIPATSGSDLCSRVGALSAATIVGVNAVLSSPNSSTAGIPTWRYLDPSAVGLSNVTNVAQVPLSYMGAASGVATLDSGGKIPSSQLPSSILGAMIYQSGWNANTNSPTIPAASAANKGWYWIVTVAGNTSEGGITDWKVGDWLVSDGVTFDKVDNTDAISTWNGRTGAVVPTSGDYTAAQVTNAWDKTATTILLGQTTTIYAGAGFGLNLGANNSVNQLILQGDGTITVTPQGTGYFVLSQSSTTVFTTNDSTVGAIAIQSVAGKNLTLRSNGASLALNNSGTVSLTAAAANAVTIGITTTAPNAFTVSTAGAIGILAPTGQGVSIGTNAVAGVLTIASGSTAASLAITSTAANFGTPVSNSNRYLSLGTTRQSDANAAQNGIIELGTQGAIWSTSNEVAIVAGSYLDASVFRWIGTNYAVEAEVVGASTSAASGFFVSVSTGTPSAGTSFTYSTIFGVTPVSAAFNVPITEATNYTATATFTFTTENTIVLTGGTTCTVTMPTGFAGRNVTIVNKNSGSATASGITILTATTCKFHYVNAQWYLIERVANV